MIHWSVISSAVSCSDVNKDLGFKAKAKDLGFKAKDLGFKAKAKDLNFKAKDLTQVLESRPRTWGSVLKDRQGPRPRTHHREQFQNNFCSEITISGSFQESFQKLENFHSKVSGKSPEKFGKSERKKLERNKEIFAWIYCSLQCLLAT